MSSGLIATKIGMSRVFTESGEAVPVTYLKIQPNTVVRTKTVEKDGYCAVVLGTNPKTIKTRKGKEHTKYRTQKEWQVEQLDGLNAGTELTADIIPGQSMVTITGLSKGKGFQGVIKRHKFSRGPETHGSHHHRRPGSVGMKEWPGRVLKGKKMPGRMGGDTVTLKNLPVVVVDHAEGVVGIKGPVPGGNGATVYVTFEFEPEFAVAAGDAVEVTEGTKETEVTEDTSETSVPSETSETPEKETKETEEPSPDAS